MDYFSDYYKDNVSMRMLLQLIPSGVGSSIDVYLTDLIDKYKKEKLKIFFDEISSGKIEITREIIESDEFLFAFFATTKAVINTKRQEKIRLFGQLFKNNICNNYYKKERYEQFISILDDLSFQEIQILDILYSYEICIPKITDSSERSEASIQLQEINSVWSNFEGEVYEKLNITPVILRNMLTMLNRTGLYETIIGTFFGYAGGKGRTTPLYREFREWILEDNENVIPRHSTE